MSNGNDSPAFDPNPPGFEPRPLEDTSGSLVAKLIPVVDKIRQLNTILGIRPYRVFLMHTKWTGGARGSGTETVTSEEEILPTPEVDIEEMEPANLNREFSPYGIREEGGVVLTEISLNYSEHVLLGRSNSGTIIPKDESFYWEIREDGSSTPSAPRKRRFHAASIPSKNPDNVCWSIRLLRAQPDRAAAQPDRAAFTPGDPGGG